MSNGTLNDALAELQNALLKLHTAAIKQFSGNWYEIRIRREADNAKKEIQYLNNLIAAQSELIKDQSDRLKLGPTMTGHIAALDATIKAQQTITNKLGENAEQALGFIGQIMNHTEDTHIEHFVDMAEQ